MSSHRIQLRDGSSIDMPSWYYDQAHAKLKHRGARLTIEGSTPETKGKPIVTFLTTEIVSIHAIDSEVRDVTVNPPAIVVNVAAPNVQVEPAQVTLQMPDQQVLTVERGPNGLIEKIMPA